MTKLLSSDLLESIEILALENWGATTRLALAAVQYINHDEISVRPGKVWSTDLL